jgi:hypothetical protein
MYSGEDFRNSAMLIPRGRKGGRKRRILPAKKKPRTSFGVNTSLKKDPLFKTSNRHPKITTILLPLPSGSRIIFFKQKGFNFFDR